MASAQTRQIRKGLNAVEKDKQEQWMRLLQAYSTVKDDLTEEDRANAALQVLEEAGFEVEVDTSE